MIRNIPDEQFEEISDRAVDLLDRSDYYSVHDLARDEADRLNRHIAKLSLDRDLEWSAEDVEEYWRENDFPINEYSSGTKSSK